MTHVALVISGIVLLSLGVLGFLFPVTSNGYTIFQATDLCGSGSGQLAQIIENFFGINQTGQKCLEYKYASYGVVGIGIIGVILLVIGSVIPSRTKDESTCPYCNFVPSSKTDLLKHKAANHLDESPYVCEHCDFVGITEEILWNHYNDKHPDKKKW